MVSDDRVAEAGTVVERFRGRTAAHRSGTHLGGRVAGVGNRWGSTRLGRATLTSLAAFLVLFCVSGFEYLTLGGTPRDTAIITSITPTGKERIQCRRLGLQPEVRIEYRVTSPRVSTLDDTFSMLECADAVGDTIPVARRGPREADIHPYPTNSPLEAIGVGCFGAVGGFVAGLFWFRVKS